MLVPEIVAKGVAIGDAEDEARDERARDGFRGDERLGGLREEERKGEEGSRGGGDRAGFGALHPLGVLVDVRGDGGAPFGGTDGGLLEFRLSDERRALRRDGFHLSLGGEYGGGLGLEVREGRLLGGAQRAGDLALLAAELSGDLGRLLGHLGVHLEGRGVARGGGDLRLLRADRGVGADHRLDGVHVHHRLDRRLRVLGNAGGRVRVRVHVRGAAADEEARATGIRPGQPYAPNARGDARRTRGVRGWGGSGGD